MRFRAGRKRKMSGNNLKQTRAAEGEALPVTGSHEGVK